MPTVLLCSTVDLESELRETAIFRDGVQRRVCSTYSEACGVAREANAQLLVVDRDLPRATDLVATLRGDAATRGLSIVVAARGEFSPTEVDLLEVGANAVLRLPAGREWNDRVIRLLSVPLRRDARFSVDFDVLALAGGHSGSGMAINLSVSGLLLECGSPLSVGDDVMLEFSLPGSTERIKVGGRVVRLARVDRFGVEFLEYLGHAREKISHFVDALGAFGF